MSKADKPKRSKRSRHRKPKQQSSERVIELPVPDTEDAEEADRILAKNVPGWTNLDKREQAELASLAQAYRGQNAPVQVKMTRNTSGGWVIEPKGKSELLGLLKLHQAFSANSIDPVNARANELLRYLSSVGADNEGRYNAALSFIESMEPRDQTEALLLVQMYVTHDSAIRALCQLGTAEWVPTAQTFGNLAAKLLRISSNQMETLAKLRRGGEQVIRHVHVDNRGGQAVFADNVQTGGQNDKIDGQSHATGATGESAAMLGQDTEGNGVPITGGQGQEKVPDARRDKSGRT